MEKKFHARKKNQPAERMAASRKNAFRLNENHIVGWLEITMPAAVRSADKLFHKTGTNLPRTFS